MRATSQNEIFTPGTIYSLIEEKIKSLRKALSEKNEDMVSQILDPRGKLRSDVPEIMSVIVKEFSRPDIDDIKVVVLVDELEGQYGFLQDKAHTKDRSPLRDWLESKSYLKFLSFAPAGIYELGGADRDRVKRIVLPPAEIDYVREKLIKDVGRSNACWWLSRGKARQLFKAYEVLNEKTTPIETTEAFRIIRDELDPIGQEPTQVPPAVTGVIDPSRIHFLLNLRPIEGESAKRHVIDTNKLKSGELADKLVEAFNINKDNAILISEYFKRTIGALSDENGVSYIQDRDLPELFCLVFDHLLEYEHGSPELSETLGEILNLYEKVRREEAALYGIVGRLWELKETKIQLPLSLGEIRRAFPFPTMNPIVKNYVPAEMKKKWEGKELPIWQWAEGDITILFFASERDFASYQEKDEFLSVALLDSKGLLCLFPTDEKLVEKKPIITWLEKNEKFKSTNIPHLLTDFLLSSSGEIQGGIPGDLNLCLKNFKENKEDILLSRKSEIYGDAIRELIRSSLPKPETYHKGTPPDAIDIWGENKVKDRDPMITGIALAFVDLSSEEKQLLANLRELFKSEKEGTGDLRPLLPRGGLPTLADDILIRYGRKGELRDSEPVSRLKGYWRDDERNKLIELARILPLDDFLKLHSDGDMRRLLEALWRAVRGDFDFDGIDTLVQKLEKNILPILKDCHELEKNGIDNFGLSGLNFEDKESLVKAKNGFEKLLEMSKHAIYDKGHGSSLLKHVAKIFIISLDIETDVVKLESLCVSAKRSLEDLLNVGDNLRKNFWEYPKATKFVGTKEEDMEALISEQLKIGGTLTLQKLQSDANERKEYLEGINGSLSQLDIRLNELGKIFNIMKEAKMT